MEKLTPSDIGSHSKSERVCLFAIFRGIMLLFFSLIPGSANAQDVLSAFLLKTTTAFTPSGKLPGTVMLNGTVEWTAGSTHENGNLQLKVSADGSTSEVWTLPTRPYSTLQGALGASRTCSYTDSANKEHALRDLNCYRAVPWFSPWMGAQLVKPGLATAVNTTESSDFSLGLERITFTPNMALSDATGATPDATQSQGATSVSITYAIATGLPEAIEYNQVFDSEASHSLNTKVVFSDYRSEAGVVIPHHLQRYIQRTLQADILITSVTIE